jgi:hypothetical protein
MDWGGAERPPSAPYYRFPLDADGAVLVVEVPTPDFDALSLDALWLAMQDRVERRAPGHTRIERDGGRGREIDLA